MIRIKFDTADIKAMLNGMTMMVQRQVISDLTTETKKQIQVMKLSQESNLLQSVMPDEQRGIMFVNAPYAGWVEWGTPGVKTAPPGIAPGRKGAPPMEKMERWAKQKLASKYGTSNSKKRKNLEHAMAKKWQHYIYLHGTKPHPFVRNAKDIIEMRYRRMKIKINIKKVV